MQTRIVHSCDKPISCVNPRYRSEKWTEDKRITQRRPDYKLSVPCGHCITCRQKRSRSWQFRLIREAEHTPTHKLNGKLAPRVLFMTFTFNDEHLPNVPSNDKERDILAPFVKQWRENWRKTFGTSPRYFAVSDLGTESARLHLHILLFNPIYKNGKPLSRSKFYRYNRQQGNTKVPSSRQNCLWKYGFVTYCEYLKGLEGIHYASGYMTCANAEKKAKKHKKTLHPLARKHFASIFVSQGLGKAFIYTPTFAQLRNLRASVCKVGNYTYAVPRYFKLYYFDEIVIPAKYNDGILVQTEHIISRQDQYSAFQARNILKLHEFWNSQHFRPPIYIKDTPYDPLSERYRKEVDNRLRLYCDNCFDVKSKPNDVLANYKYFNQPTFTQLTLWQTTKTAPQVNLVRIKPHESLEIGTTVATPILLRSQLVEWYQLCASFFKVTAP